MKTILAPVDFSDVSEAVIEAAQLLAEAVHGRIVVVSIVQPPILTSDLAPMTEDVGEIMALREKTAGRQLDRLATRLRKPKLPIDTVQLTGFPAPLILEQAEKESADYIVMGSHGHTALYDLIVGSTTHQVLKKAPCPVMIVPPPLKKAVRRKTLGR